MKKLCLVVSSSYPLEVFLLAQIRAITRFYDVTVVVNTNNAKLLDELGLNARLFAVRIERKIHPGCDLLAILILFRLFTKQKFDIIHSVTPKAGLLSMAAAYLARRPIRIHTFTGQVWSTKHGPLRSLLKVADRTTAFLSSDILVDSISQRDFIVHERVVPIAKATVLGNGSISGVNLGRFRPAPEFRSEIRIKHGIRMNSYVILYMARLTRDKGALVMAEAFAAYGLADENAELLVVGPDEESLRPQIMDICGPCIDRVHFVDFVHVPEQYMASADVFCLPSYREGFGTSLINAAAVGIPAVASNIYGSSDAVADGVTGLLFEAGNIADCVAALRRLGADSNLRASMGREARRRVEEQFSEEALTSSLLAYYESRLMRNINDAGQANRMSDLR